MRRNVGPGKSINHQSDIYNYVCMDKYFYYDAYVRN